MDIYDTNFISFNCKNVKRSVDGIKELCDFADIIALQETWLMPHDLPFLDTIHVDFGSTGTSAVDTTAGIVTLISQGASAFGGLLGCGCEGGRHSGLRSCHH